MKKNVPGEEMESRSVKVKVKGRGEGVKYSGGVRDLESESKALETQ